MYIYIYIYTYLEELRYDAPRWGITAILSAVSATLWILSTQPLTRHFPVLPLGSGHLQRLDQCLRKGPAARAGFGAIRSNAAARRGAHGNHLQRLDQCLRKGQGARAGPGAIRGKAAARRGARRIHLQRLGQ